MEFSSFLSSLRSVTDQLDKVGDPQLSTVVPQTFSPHTRIDRAKASSQSLSQTQQILKSLGDHLIQTELFRDSLRLEYARAINSLCPALQLPEEVLRAVFIFRAEDEHPNDMFLIHICRQWRATALACPQLWTTIYTSDSLPMIQRALQLSSNHPLDLIFSRTPPQNLRKFENEMGSMQVLVDQIQTRSISNLLVEGDGINDNIDLRGAFGRGSILSVLHVESIDISYAQSRKYLDMQHVEFPCCRHFTVEGSSLPILGTSQLSCQFLTIIALTAIPHYFIDFLLGFKALEDIEFREIGIRDLPSQPLPLPTLENLLLSRLTANVFMLLSGVVRMEDIYSVYLSEFLTYGAEDKSASALMHDAQALTQFLAQPGQYSNLTYLQMSDTHELLPISLNCVLGSRTTLPFPQLQDLSVVVHAGAEFDNELESRQSLVTSITKIISNRRAQGSENIVLHLPPCLRDIKSELTQITGTIMWDRWCHYQYHSQ